MSTSTTLAEKWAAQQVTDKFDGRYGIAVAAWLAGYHAADAVRIAAVQSLCQDTDSNWLEPTTELPVGEFQVAVSRTSRD